MKKFMFVFSITMMIVMSMVSCVDDQVKPDSPKNDTIFFSKDSVFIGDIVKIGDNSITVTDSLSCDTIKLSDVVYIFDCGFNEREVVFVSDYDNYTNDVYVKDGISFVITPDIIGTNFNKGRYHFIIDYNIKPRLYPTDSTFILEVRFDSATVDSIFHEDLYRFSKKFSFDSMYFVDLPSTLHTIDIDTPNDSKLIWIRRGETYRGLFPIKNYPYFVYGKYWEEDDDLIFIYDNFNTININMINSSNKYIKLKTSNMVALNTFD